MYAYCEEQGLEIDTLIHEDGAAQMEINLQHGDPLELADQVFMFKRTIKEAALKHKTYATFMAKPMAGEPGSAMHVHQSLVDAETGRNIFSDPKTGEATDIFYQFLAGQQKYLPGIVCMLAPYVNSYRRFTRDSMPRSTCNGVMTTARPACACRLPAPKRGASRTACRLRMPIPILPSPPFLRRLSRYRGELNPTQPIDTSAKSKDFQLPRSLLDAVAKLEEAEELQAVLGKSFVDAYAAIKREEFETFMRVISPGSGSSCCSCVRGCHLNVDSRGSR